MIAIGKGRKVRPFQTAPCTPGHDGAIVRVGARAGLYGRLSAIPV